MALVPSEVLFIEFFFVADVNSVLFRRNEKFHNVSHYFGILPVVP